MSILSFIRNKHNFVFKLIVVFIFSLVITFFLPKKAVNYHELTEFEAIWTYPDLILEEDLLISKTKKEIDDEKSELITQAPIYFQENKNELTLKLQEFEKLKTENNSSYRIIKPILDSIYKIGIIESVEPNDLTKPLLLYDGVYAKQLVYNNYFTIQSAIEYASDKINSVDDKTLFLNYLSIIYYKNNTLTQHFLDEKLNSVSLYKFVYRKGTCLIKQNEKLTKNTKFLINRYINQQSKTSPNTLIKFTSQLVLVIFILIILMGYLYYFRKPIFGNNQQIIFLLIIPVICVLALAFITKYGLLIYSFPFMLIPILVRVFFDGRTALFTLLISVLMCCFFISDKFQFVLLQLLTGISTLFVVAEMRKRQQLINAAVISLIIYSVLFILYNLGFGNVELILLKSSYLPFLISTVLILLAYPLILLCEKLFGFISDFKLLELCDLSQPLLRQLSQDVPGTFQHSLQVANLAEEAIYYIGGNTLLVRTGALYHDIGKINNPHFFTENVGNSYSPHLEMQPLESAKIIINHVIDGIEMAKKHNLPESIIDFIRTHHGTTSVGYFLQLYQKQNNTLVVDETEFKYKGPIPFSKETAVLMLADGVEAASRSLNHYDAVSISELVDNIIDYKIKQNQLINADVTFKDITTIKKIFKKRLLNIYHARIAYPSSN
ncbi:MAG: HDIG domain-containing protein [Bacteroidetes bacterium]|nr:HDIG domain-containing protein [Bacteroidota bacterium]